MYSKAITKGQPLPFHYTAIHMNYTAIVLYLQNDLQYLPSGVVPDMEIEMSCFDDTVNKYNVLRIG